jgi:catechol 2,3-dioxygenase-like lactoylglutathione lyase family enzyme
MAKIRHITITTENPGQVADFYKEVFGMEEIRRHSENVSLTDGYINLNIRRWKTEKDSDVGPHGPNYSGIHHIGFQVDDLEQTCSKLEQTRATKLSQEGLESKIAAGAAGRGFSNDMKWAGPDGQVIDISKTGWRKS